MELRVHSTNTGFQSIRTERRVGAATLVGKPKGFTLMHTVLAHTYFHIGQCEDIRGLLGFSTL